jgi:hypothetical protein
MRELRHASARILQTSAWICGVVPIAAGRDVELLRLGLGESDRIP